MKKKKTIQKYFSKEEYPEHSEYLQNLIGKTKVFLLFSIIYTFSSFDIYEGGAVNTNHWIG